MRSKTAINRFQLLRSSATVAVIATALLCTQATLAQNSRPVTFPSVSQAADALYQAVKDSNEHAVEVILGAAPELTSSGNQATDKLERERFVQKYREMHRFVRESDGSTVLYIGPENWPFPIPLVEKSGKWYFDADAGGQEVLAREIGQNEMTAIRVCQDLGKTSRPGLEAAIDEDGIHQFAGTLAGASDTKPVRGPFHGYYFLVEAKRPGGVVLVAYPEEYRNSGVMTFIVTAAGSVYEKDLGPQTGTLPQATERPQTAGWAPVQ